MPVDLQTIRAGDRVRLTPRTRTFAAPAGTIGTVQNPPTRSSGRGSLYLQVAFDPGSGQGDGGYEPRDFDLIPIVHPGEIVPQPPEGVTENGWIETLRFEMERRRGLARQNMDTILNEYIRPRPVVTPEPEPEVDDEEVKTIWY